MPYERMKLWKIFGEGQWVTTSDGCGRGTSDPLHAGRRKSRRLSPGKFLKK